MSKDKLIKEYLTFECNYVDLFYAYCNTKGIDDPESDLTDEEYDRLDKECESIITPAFLRDMNREINEGINECIFGMMRSQMIKNI